MKRLVFASIVLLVISNAAFGSDLTFTLNPLIEYFPPGAGAALCETNGTSPLCVMFSGTLTDSDTDLSVMNLDSLTIDFAANPAAAAYFTTDNTFFIDPPGILVGDPTSPLHTYTGPIFGLDIAPSTPPGVYSLTADLGADGGTNDPTNGGFTVTSDFTVVITPEPVSWGLVLAGFLGLGLRARRSRSC
jgi:hypothetical protein